MSLDKKKIRKNLKKKGFIENLDGPHIKYVFRRENRTDKIVTHVSHGGGKTIGKQLVSDMANQCKLTTVKFRKLVDCTMSGDDYINELKSTDRKVIDEKKTS